jgi:hypothetical protein
MRDENLLHVDQTSMSSYQHKVNRPIPFSKSMTKRDSILIFCLHFKADEIEIRFCLADFTVCKNVLLISDSVSSIEERSSNDTSMSQSSTDGRPKSRSHHFLVRPSE